MLRSPVVAVTGTVEIIRGAPRVLVNEAYTDAVRAAGLIPLVVPPIGDGAFVADVLASIDGLLLTGGEDINPSRFGAVPHPANDAANEPRDQCEIQLARFARDRSIPTLAICRGAQVVNVAFGGTLIQDIPTEREGSLAHNRGGDRGARVHPVTIEPGSRLDGIVGRPSISTNSFHHQSADRLGDGLRVTAVTEDGIVEGIEATGDDWWMIGVQWHPEELMAAVEDWDRKLFAAFADAVRSTASAPRPALAASAAPGSTRWERAANH